MNKIREPLSISFCQRIRLFLFKNLQMRFFVFYISSFISLFQVSTTEKADISFVFSPKNLLLCGLPHQKAESLHVVCNIA